MAVSQPIMGHCPGGDRCSVRPWCARSERVCSEPSVSGSGRQLFVRMAVAALALAAWASSVGAPVSQAPVRLVLERELGAGRAQADLANQDLPTFLAADRVSGRMDDRAVFEGHAELRKAGTVLRADRIDYLARSDELVAQGQARVYSDGLIIFGPRLDLQLDAQTGRMENASYEYTPRNGRGQADVFELLGDGKSRLTRATYTTCSPQDQAWWVRAERLDLDRDAGVAKARNIRLYFQGVPVLASPVFFMPLGDERRSGMLTPSFGVNSRLGAELTVPLYWNISPQKDMTLAPRIMARRGVLLQTESRYLEPRWRGVLELDAIAKDREFGRSRDRVSFRHEQALAQPVFGGAVTGGINFNRVSDDDFFVDFGRTSVSASQSVLPQEGWLVHGRGPWVSSLRVSKNQTLLSLLEPGEQPPYERVPQLNVGAEVFDRAGFDVNLKVEATRFEQNTVLPNILPREPGTRLIVHPSVAYPIQGAGWFLVPKLQYHTTAYYLDAARRPQDRSPSRQVPISSLDAGLVFERSASWFGSAAMQTIEPRLFYTHIPYREQNDLPNFDSGLADFNFAQLFSENVFVGGDRIGQANQVTAALVGRVLDGATGAQRLRVALGQRYFFSPQRVVLPGQMPRTDKESDVLGSLSGALGRHWTLDALVQHSTLQKQVVRATMGVRYQPRAASVLSLAYRFKLDELDQVDVAAQWPLRFIGLPRWYGVVRTNYSRRESRVVESLGGLEYKADCWVLRLVGQRFITSKRSATTTFFLQIELNGLSSVGSSPVESLKRNIPGYQLINPPPAEPGRFDSYE